ncbi:CCAAT-binding protein subunit HAP3 [Tolypocladium paradoxum]|uniref:CCAAT-binding protein subunit HAP3 n=1 Tax=Tolypocladium paradoxum TaxID=94208 RepID=A0A2S4L131_9HYPO|nr:CCAAT-binding protein subunit HAP3 [Tolypocladium paradoxum]
MSDSPQSPPKDVDHGAQSPDEEGQMNENHDPQSAGLASYEFEGVKEQDRWLPIANGNLPCLSIRPQPRMPICPAMSHDSPTNPAGTPRAPKADKADDLDANIRNFAPVARIMKNALPDNAKIAKEAKECMQECVSEFISFITSEASEKCQQEKRKTVNGEDILFAMTSLGFENYAEALKVYLSKYREQQNQSNRDRVMENTWGGSMMPGEKGEPGAGGGEYAGGEGSATADGSADPNYMYGSHAAHNGAGAGEGY